MSGLTKDYIDNMYSIKNKIAIVTGATGALGSTIAKAYGFAGAKVFMADINEDKLIQQKEAYVSEGIDCDYGVADLTDVEQTKALIEKCVNRYGEVNILAIAHGYNKPQNMLEQSVEDWQKIMDIDCKSVYVTCKYVAEQMIKQNKGGKIVVVTSQRSKRAYPGYTGYCTSKGGADLMISCMASELTAKYGINVNSICPTVFRSALTEWLFDPSLEAHKAILARQPSGRLGEPEDFVGMVIYLSSPASDFMTGANYDCSGGYLVV